MVWITAFSYYFQRRSVHCLCSPWSSAGWFSSFWTFTASVETCNKTRIHSFIQKKYIKVVLISSVIKTSEIIETACVPYCFISQGNLFFCVGNVPPTEENAFTSACICWEKCLSSLDTLSSRVRYLWVTRLYSIKKTSSKHDEHCETECTELQQTVELVNRHTYPALSFSFPLDQQKYHAFPLKRSTREILFKRFQRI